MTSSPTAATQSPDTESAEQRHQRIREAFEQNRSQMTVVLARQLGVQEIEVIRALPPEMAMELDATRWEQLIRSFEDLGNVHVIASNGSVTLECFGQFGKFSTWGDYFNVQTKSLDMHIRSKTLESIFAIEKPGHMDGVQTVSFQFFNKNGDAAFKVFLTFGGNAPSPEVQSKFEAIREQFKLDAGH